LPNIFMVLTDGLSNLKHVIAGKRIMRSAVTCTVLIVERHIWTVALYGTETCSFRKAEDK